MPFHNSDSGAVHVKIAELEVMSDNVRLFGGPPGAVEHNKHSYV